MALFIVALIIFIIADIIIRFAVKHFQEQKAKKQRAAVLEESLKLDFSSEAKTLKRAEVENPKARILCVDDEPIILDSFRKILVLDGYSVDTVESGKEALSLIRKHHYDFVFTDLKMPEMDGVEVTKAVKHLRPDIDVVIITGYATVQSAVECMKYGAMDYVEKPFTEDELIDFVNKLLLKREEKIKKQLKPRVQITHFPDSIGLKTSEFAIPGGVFISENHCWLSMDPDGMVRVGIDDFAKKLIGKIDGIEFPNLGMKIEQGQPLFIIKQNNRTIPFKSPVNGKVVRNNKKLIEDLDNLEITPYEENWICTIDADNLDEDLAKLKIGKSAVNFYQEEIDDCIKTIDKILEKDSKELLKEKGLYLGIMENLKNSDWQKVAEKFFIK